MFPYFLLPLGMQRVAIINAGDDFKTNIICVEYITFNVSE
jgi:hypothetical protein